MFLKKNSLAFCPLFFTDVTPNRQFFKGGLIVCRVQHLASELFFEPIVCMLNLTSNVVK